MSDVRKLSKSAVAGARRRKAALPGEISSSRRATRGRAVAVLWDLRRNEINVWVCVWVSSRSDFYGNI